MVRPTLPFEDGEGVPGTPGRLGVLTLLPQVHGTFMEPAGILNADRRKGCLWLAAVTRSRPAAGLFPHVYPSCRTE
jgi:hypothetical protein